MGVSWELFDEISEVATIKEVLTFRSLGRRLAQGRRDVTQGLKSWCLDCTQLMVWICSLDPTGGKKCERLSFFLGGDGGIAIRSCGLIMD